jgi:hypothetical protein
MTVLPGCPFTGSVELAILEPIHRGHDIPCSGPVNASSGSQLRHLDLLSVRRPNQQPQEGERTTPGKYV